MLRSAERPGVQLMSVRIALLFGYLLATRPVDAAPLRLHLDWDDVQAVISHAEFSPRVTVRTGADGKGLVKGRLANITDAGITIDKPKSQRFVRRDEIFWMLPRHGTAGGASMQRGPRRRGIGTDACWGASRLAGGHGASLSHHRVTSGVLTSASGSPPITGVRCAERALVCGLVGLLRGVWSTGGKVFFPIERKPWMHVRRSGATLPASLPGREEEVPRQPGPEG